MESDLGKLFVGGISWDTDEDRLREYFGKYGEVMEAVIMRDRTTGRARGFGFVVFADAAVAERIIMDKHIIDGRTVEAKKAVPRDDLHIFNRSNSSSIHGSPGPGRTRKIFVGGLASTVTESDFKKYFEQYGNITDVVVMYDRNTQRPRGFGFITYDSEEAVDRVLLKTFHELNGKMVEVKRAVPKELSPSPSRSPLLGYNYNLARGNNFLDAYAQGYNFEGYKFGPIGNFDMRMDGRFNALTSGRSSFPPFGSYGYGMGMNIDPVLSPTYGGGSNFSSSPGYGRILSPYYSGNSGTSTTPIRYNAGNVRNDSVLGPSTRNVWGNGGITAAANRTSHGAFMSSGTGSFGVSFGNNGGNWGPSPISSQGGSSATGYNSDTTTYGSGHNSYGLGGGGYSRNSRTSVAPTSSFIGSTSNYEGSYEDLYHNGSVNGDSTFITPELETSGSFRYGIGNIASDVTTKSSEDYIGNYSVISQPNRGIAT